MSGEGFGATRTALRRADVGFVPARTVYLAASRPKPKRTAHEVHAPTSGEFSLRLIGVKAWRGLKDGAVALVVGPATRIAHVAGVPVRLGRAASTRGFAGLERQLGEEARSEAEFEVDVVKGLAHTAYVGVEMSPAGAPLIQRRIQRDGYQRTFEHLAYEGAAQVPTAVAMLATDGALSRVSALRAGNLAEFGELGAGSQRLVDELAATGVKFNPAEVVRIARDGSGRVVFLERGTETAGLAHIVNDHAAEFATRGISEAKIPDLVMKAVTEGDVVRYQGKSLSRPIYRVEFEGRTVDIAVTTGSNGFIVGANPGGF